MYTTPLSHTFGRPKVETSVFAKTFVTSVHRYTTPLVADIHFQPKVALLVADAFEKIRINPGNFSDGRKTFEETTYDDPAEFAREREYMRTVSSPFDSTPTPFAAVSSSCVKACTSVECL